jgi:PIN domain nuclease of toxin-antitoxin system
MNLLLDTHAFLWWVMDDPRLSQRARELLADGDNRLLFSAASGWEIAIKTHIGRLALPEPAEHFVPAQLAANAIENLPVLLSHALRTGALPNHHRDPFDRMLVAQSQLEGLPVLSSDPLLAQYEVEVIW